MQKEIIKCEFTKQAKTFNDYQKSFSREDINRWALNKIGLNGKEKVLEVAAGTCAFGRSVAPFVDNVEELDITDAMLEVGKAEAIKAKIDNITFTVGEAENLPYTDNSFDIVMSRLAFHHFESIDIVLKEMCRVLKENGKLVIIDMEAREENLREKADKLEKLRDKSHVRCISKTEFFEELSKNNMNVLDSETIKIPVCLDSWMKLTNVDKNIRIEIENAINEDISCGEKTGFEPYIKDDDLYFNHKWMIIVAQK